MITGMILIITILNEIIDEPFKFVNLQVQSIVGKRLHH